MTRKGTISFDLAWTASGDPSVSGNGGYFFDGPNLGMWLGGEIYRDASDGLKGRVTKSPLGPGPSSPAFATILFGPSITFDVHQ